MDVPEVDIATFAARHAEDVTVIDVREPDEYSEGHVPGAALIPLGQVPERADEVPADRAVYLICARGGRSMTAAEHLAGLGRDVVNVGGGTTAWIEAGHATTSGTTPS